MQRLMSYLAYREKTAKTLVRRYRAGSKYLADLKNGNGFFPLGKVAGITVSTCLHIVADTSRLSLLLASRPTCK